MTPAPLHAAHAAAIRAAQAGHIAAAHAAFGAAPAPVQRDSRFLADYAMFASSIGDPALAASLLARAIAATPGDAPSLRLRHALALMDAGALIEAIGRLEALTRDHPASATAWQALGAARASADRAAAAATAFDHVLSLTPADPLARLSKARMLEELGEPSVDAFAGALAVAPGNGPERLGLSAAQAAAGDIDAAVTTLRQGLASAPQWTEGWTALASLVNRWEGQAAALALAREALEAAPQDAPQAAALLRSMAAIGAHDEVLEALPGVRRTVGDTLPLALVEAQAASERGDTGRADAAFARLERVDDATVLLARVRHSLRHGRPEAAAAIGEPMMAGSAARFVIPYLGTAWRLLGDPRYDWLEGDTQLVGCHDLGFRSDDLSALAAELRTLHTARHAPFEQSLRGGTQTEGVLLSRRSPEIRALRSALERAVCEFIDRLPAPDPTHPTLSPPRAAFRFSGSWSVRLAGGGRHVNHVHSEGWLSSACYIALPDAMTGTGAQDDAGWLTLGEPPADLGLDLPPMRMVRPVCGQVVLFPSTMWHGTRPAPAGERLTVAFDLQPLT